MFDIYNEIGDKYLETRTLSSPERLVFQRNMSLNSEVLLQQGLLDIVDWSLILSKKSLGAQNFILTDDNVDKLYGNLILDRMVSAGISVQKLTIHPGESSKTLSEYHRLVNEILSNRVDRDSTIIALGGGVVNNISGFIAATIYRGIQLIQIPTTLMAQLDAAIDFKQAVNSAQGKNHLGSFYPATKIIVDPNVLKTLSLRELRSGMAEAIKHALTQDVKLVNFISSIPDKNYSSSILEEIVKRIITLKIPFINESVDAIPQYGHAIGHAIEYISEFDLLHGEAIAIGMCVMSEMAKILGICNLDCVRKHYQIFSKFQLPTTIPRTISNDLIIRSVCYDKSFSNGCINVSLISQIGKIWKNGSNCLMGISPTQLIEAVNLNRQRTESFYGL